MPFAGMRQDTLKLVSHVLCGSHAFSLIHEHCKTYKQCADPGKGLISGFKAEDGLWGMFAITLARPYQREGPRYPDLFHCGCHKTFPDWGLWQGVR